MEQSQEYPRVLESRAKAAEAALTDLLAERPDIGAAFQHQHDHRRCENCRYFSRNVAVASADGMCHVWISDDRPHRVLVYPYCNDHPDDEESNAEILVKKEFGCVHFTDKYQEKGGIISAAEPD